MTKFKVAICEHQNYLQTKINHSEPIKKTKKKVTKNSVKKSIQNKQITEYFPIRRSDRRTKKQIQNETKEEITRILQSNSDPNYLHIHEFLGKGRGVVTSKSFKRGEFVVEYSGELIDLQTANIRECQYSYSDDIGCYMYYFTHENKRFCVDATKETGRLGRLVNHSKKDGNLATKTFVVNNSPRLILIAKRDIQENEELLYDYGDRSISSIQSHPWLAQ